jgi:hypothetical protein
MYRPGEFRCTSAGFSALRLDARRHKVSKIVVHERHGRRVYKPVDSGSIVKIFSIGVIHYEVYSEMEFELNHPDKVEPCFSENVSLFERDSVRVYRIFFIASLINNPILSVLLIR